jgi:hypothetical protein
MPSFRARYASQITESGFPGVQGKQITLVTHGFNAVGLGSVILQLLRRREIATSTLRSIPS